MAINFLNNPKVGDNVKIEIGTGSDLQIYHDGSNSFITNSTGDFTISNTGDDLILKSADDFLLYVQGSELAIQAVGNAGVVLRYNNVAKFETTSTGVTVPGTVNTGGGNAATPAIIFEGNTDTGLFHPATDEIGFSTAGSERMRITSAGNLAIGTTTASSKLTVQDNSYQVMLVDTSTSNRGEISVEDAAFGFYADRAAATADSSFFWSIDDTNKMEINLTAGGEGQLRLNDYGPGNITGTAEFILGVDANGNVIETSAGGSGTVTGTGAATRVAFWSGTTALSSDANLYWDNTNDRLGIGTTAPSKQLEILYPSYINKDTVQGLIRLIGQSNTENSGDVPSAGVGIEFYNKWTGGLPYSTGRISARSSQSYDGGLQFDVSQNTAPGQTNFITAMSILDTGNVGIGLNSPTSKFNVYTSTGRNFEVDQSTSNVTTLKNDYHLRLQASNGYSLQFYTGASASQRMVIDSTGNVGIGTTSPSMALHVSRSGTTLASVGIGQTGTAPSRVYMDASNGDFSGSDYMHIGQNNDLSGEIQMESGAGAFNIKTGTGSPTRFTVLQNGNVGIGTTSPIGNFNINGGTGDTATQDAIETFTRTSSTGNVLAAKIRLVDGSATTHGDLKFQVKTTASSAENDAYYTDAITIKGSNANVGIGTTSPNETLSLYKSDRPYIQFTSNTTGTTSSDGSFIGFANADGFLEIRNKEAQPIRLSTSDTERMRITSAGNVGIGVTAPNAPLDVLSSSSGSSGIQQWSYSSAPTLYRLQLNQIVSSGLVKYSFDQLNAGTAYNNVLVLDTGKVGIGTTSPLFKLTVEHSDEDGLMFKTTNTSNTFINFADPEDNDAGQINYDHETNYMGFRTNGASRMRIDSAGNVLINATSKFNAYPASFVTQTIASSSGDNCPILELVGNRSAAFGNQNGMIQFFNKTSTAVEVGRISSIQGSASNSGQLKFMTANAGTIAERMRITSAGNVGIGTTSPDTKLDVVGGILRNSTRISGALDNRKYPLGHYNSSSNIFDIDPTWSQDELRAFFNNTGVAWVADADAPGGYAIEITGGVYVGGAYTSGFPYIPIDTSGSYYMECYVKNVTAGNGHYMGGIDFNESFGSLGGNPGSYGYWVMSNTNPGTSWTKVSGTISGFGNSTGQFKAGTKYMTPMSLFNYSGTAAAASRVTRISGWRMIRTDSPGSGFLPLAGGTLSGPVALSDNAYFTGSSTYGFRFNTSNDSLNNVIMYNSGNMYIRGNVGLGTTLPTNGGGNANWLSLNAVTSSPYSGGIAYTIANAVKAYHYVESGYLRHQAQLGVGHRFTVNGTTDAMYMTSAGNVGIGTTSPGAKLEVVGDSRIYDSLNVGYRAASTSTTNYEPRLILSGKNNYSDGTTWYGNYGQLLLTCDANMSGSSRRFLITNALDNNKFAIVRSANATSNPVVNSTAAGVNNGTADFVIDNTGSVGIGTTSPTAKLTVVDNSNILSFSEHGSSAVAELKIIGAQAHDTAIYFGDSVDNVRAGFYYDVSSNQLQVRGYNNSTKIAVTSAGKVGIGTTNPGGTLHVDAPTITANSLTYGAAAGQIFTNENSEFAFGLLNASPYPLYIQGRTHTNTARNITLQGLGGNIGISTYTPGAKLHVVSGDEVLRLESTQTTGSPYMTFYQTTTRRSYIQQIDSGNNLALASEYGGILFYTGTGGTETQKMVIQSNGNVGIGTTNPVNPLQVTGKIYSSTDIQAASQVQAATYRWSATTTPLEQSGALTSSEPANPPDFTPDGYIEIKVQTTVYLIPIFEKQT